MIELKMRILQLACIGKQERERERERERESK